MSTKTANLGLTKPERSDNYSVDVMGKNMDIIDERITALEAGEFESITAKVGNFSKIILTGRLSYNGYYSTGTYGNIGATNTFHTVPIISSIIPLNGVVSLKTSTTASSCNLYIVSSEGITSHALTTTQTEYTVTNGLNIYVVMKPSGGTTLTIGCPVIE